MILYFCWLGIYKYLYWYQICLMSFRKDDSFTPSNNSLDDLVIFKKAVFNKSISCDQSFKSDSRNDSLRSDYK